MREYALFWIKDEFSSHYFHKTNILFDFLKEWKYHPDHTLSTTQFQYVTKPIPLDMLVHYVTEKNRKPVEMTYYQNKMSFVIQCKGQNIRLTQMSDREVRITAESLHQAETMIFETLRTFNHSFFIMDEDMRQYGWIAPIKKEAIL
ncbi:sporulation inhibitor of replication protein SirA [Pontibacillus salipaludis]|uniref:Sporulation inhibitor of replication protein SirA n=1 Tax=Pontibacillus salipaludis TaxID=1697394 RepID=A0ABQ1PJ87_9BACI|nr:sporulation inhibitor of replication protein SirA [Pontibacillus salipaludis]GGC97948.1 hypothetical protein GCM10011389_01370 [Pontibacillus salipaludis]